MGRTEDRIDSGMRNRIQELLVADGVRDQDALAEANSLCDGLGYYHRVKASTGMSFARGYDGVEVQASNGDRLETIPFPRTEEYF